MILSHKALNKDVIKYLQQTVCPHRNIVEARFLAYLLTVIKNDDGLSPTSARFIEDHFEILTQRHWIKDLESNGLIEVIWSYDKGRGKCREYGPSPKLILVYAEYLLSHEKPFSGSIRRQPDISSESTLIESAMKSVSPKLLYGRVERNLRELLEVSKTGQSFRDIVKRINNDVNNLTRIRSKPNFYISDSGIATYDPEFVVGKTGRIFEINGGLQGLSRESKRIAYKDNFNYDIRSSQIAALIHYCKILNIDHTALQTYVGNPASKYEFAEKVGISVDTWKTCLISTLFGAYYKSKYGQPYQSIKKEVGFSESFAKFKTYLEVTSDLFKPIAEWMKRVKKYALENSDSLGGIINSAGKYYRITTKTTSKFLSAFYLQGLESAFVYLVTAYSGHAGIKIISNEFDGLVTDRLIPDELIEAARVRSGFTEATLS